MTYIRVAIVEDEPDIREAMMVLFPSDGWRGVITTFEIINFHVIAGRRRRPYLCIIKQTDKQGLPKT